MPIFIALLYVFIGAVVAVPYCLLAGWNWDDWVAVVAFAPAYLIVWMFLGLMTGTLTYRPGRSWFPITFDRKPRKSLPGTKGVFILWTIYGLLPIIVHWTAVLLRWGGQTQKAALLESHRYMSGIYAFCGTIVLIVFLMLLGTIWKEARDRLTTRRVGMMA